MHITLHNDLHSLIYICVKESFRTAIVRLLSLANLKILLNVTINKITQVKCPIAQVCDYNLKKLVD